MAGPSDSGGWSSDGGSPDDLPDLPEEWGVIVIPDDLSELSDEVEAIRAELRLSDEPSRWRRFADRPGIRRLRQTAAATLRAPILIISMAVLVTVASLFASAWPGPPRQPATQRTATTITGEREKLPALELIGTDGLPAMLNSRLPAVILLIDECDCADLVTATVAAVPPEITVITVVTVAKATATASVGVTPQTGAAPQAQGKTVRVLHDQAGTVRSRLKLAAGDGTAAAILVDHAGRIVRTVPRTASVEDIRPLLASL